MRNLWDHVDGKLGGKALFDKISGYKLERTIRLIIIKCKQMDSRIGIVLSGRKEESPMDGYENHVKMFLYMRHLPPWWGTKVREELRKVLLEGTLPYGLCVLVLFSQTPAWDAVDNIFVHRHDRVVACKHNLKKCREYLKSCGLKKSDIMDIGFQPNNGFVMTTDGRILPLPRRCYDIIKGSEASPAKEHHEKI